MQDRQLTYLLAAVEEGSFTHAAIRCEVAQPTLSASIARLERELGSLLFHRIGRTISPTDACLALVPAARDVVRSTQCARDAVLAVNSGERGRLDIAVQPTAIGLAVELVSSFRLSFPGVALRIRSTSDDSVADLVATGSAELGIGDVVPLQSLTWEELWTEDYVCVETFNRSSETSSAMRVQDVSNVPVIAPPEGSPTRAVLDQWLASAGAAPHVVVEVDHREALLPLVSAGCGLAVVPRSLAEGMLTDLKISVRPLDPPVERRVGIAHRDAPLTPVAKHFLDLAAGSEATPRSILRATSEAAPSDQ